VTAIHPAWQAFSWKTPQGYGALADGRAVFDAVTNGTTTITSATAAFTSADTGKIAVITGSADGDPAAGNQFAAAISSVANATTAILASAPSFSVTAANLVIGSDNKAAINSWLTAVSGGQGHVPAGIYVSTGTHTVPPGTFITGDGYDYGPAPVSQPPVTGSCLIFGGTGNPAAFITLGNTTAENVNLADVAVDASNLAQVAVVMNSLRGNVVQRVQAWRGTVAALQASTNGGSAGTFLVEGCVLGQQNVGDPLRVYGNDCVVANNILRQPGAGGACAHVINASDFLYIGNHSWAGHNAALSSTYPANHVLIDATGLIISFGIIGNLLDGVYGDAIKLNPTGGASRIAGVAVSGNISWSLSGMIDNTFSFVNCGNSTNNNIRGLSISGNSIMGQPSSGLVSLQYMLNTPGGASISQVSVTGNTGRGVRAIWPAGYRPDGGRDGNISSTVDSGGTTLASSNDGTATFSGDGVTTTFAITHGLGVAPTTVNLTAASAAAAAAFWWSASSTTITVTYLVAPANGSGNVVISWKAVI
jgi:hypothetical protein